MRNLITRPLSALGLAISLSLASVVSQADDNRQCQTVLTENTLTLSAAISYGLCQNPDTQSVWAQLLAQQAAVAVSEDSNKPSVSLQASANSNINDSGDHSNSAALQARLSYLLFDFGQRLAEQKQARALAEAAQFLVDVTTMTVTRDIVAAYVAVLKAQAQIDASAQNLRAANQSLTSAEARYKVGTGTPLDVLQAKAAAAQAQLSSVQAQSQLAARRGELALAMGLKPTLLPAVSPMQNLPLTLPVKADELEQLLTQAVQNRAEVKIAQANVNAAEQSILSAKSANKPSLSLSASTGLQQTQDERQTSGSVGVTLDVPLDFGGGQKARIRQSEAQKTAKIAALTKSQQSVEQQAWQAFYAAQAAIETVNAAQNGLDSADKASQVASGRYQAGVGTMLEVLTAQSQRASSEQQLVAARYDWLTARMQLAYALGQPLLPAINAPMNSRSGAGE